MTAFRTRARAVEMLGRQQIANLPTALSEMFKNAHDAYATVAKAEYFRNADLLLVHDDGVGMSRETFQDSWLTIATESKRDGYRVQADPPDGMKPRTPLGSKGIGRLAVGILGSQVLIVSKHIGHRPVAALVNWDMFSLDGIELSQVPVGLTTLDRPALLPDDVATLKAPLLRAIADLRAECRGNNWQSRLDDVARDIDTLPDDPYGLVDGAATISDDVSGTHIFVCPVSDDLASDISSDSPDASVLSKTLHGFTDKWLDRSNRLDFDIDFIDHRPGGDSESLLRPEDFFSDNDFTHADHEIDGEFEASGNFKGSIRIFDNDAHSVEFSSPLKSAPRCGPFGFRLATIQGLGSESGLNPEAFADISRRTRQLGGLYVYKDGIRVQPYGRPDFDYLGIEERRTFGVGHYYFSYRRMFGAVALTTADNAALKEKAGREGFTQGGPYRDFRKLLINLFKEIAAAYFRSGGEHESLYAEGRERLKAQHAARKTRDQQMAARRRAFNRKLADATEFLDNTDIGEQVLAIAEKANAAAVGASSIHEVSRTLSACRSRLLGILSPLQIDDPEGFAITQPMRRDLAMIRRERDKIESAYVTPMIATVAELGSSAEARLTVQETDLKRRSADRDGFIKEASKEIAGLEKKSLASLKKLRDAIFDQIHDTTRTAEESLSSLERADGPDSGGWVEQDALLQDRVSEIQAEARRALGRMHSFVLDCLETMPDMSADSVSMAEAADAEILELRARADDQLELVQLGMALAVVDHEFQAMVRDLRSDIRRVGAWARKNPPMRSLYMSLRRDFDHLDTYLTLLTPMQRRIRRSKTEIRGVDIYRFLSQLFFDRLRETSVVLTASEAFKSFTVVGFASTFYPVFVNLVDNSLYWLESSESSGSSDAGSIDLNAFGSSMVVDDSGPGIDPVIADEIFDFGFSTRPGGRGLGLAIADQILDRAGWGIRFEHRESGGSRFVLSPKSQETT